jgi:hypothetical protein
VLSPGNRRWPAFPGPDLRHHRCLYCNGP